MMFPNLNEQYLIEGERQGARFDTKWLNEPANDLKLQISNYKLDTGKNLLKVFFNVVDGKYKGYSISDGYVLSDQAYWKLRILYVKAGLFEIRDDFEGNAYKHITAASYGDLKGKYVVADYVKNKNNDFLGLTNMREYLEIDQINDLHKKVEESDGLEIPESNFDFDFKANEA